MPNFQIDRGFDRSKFRKGNVKGSENTASRQVMLEDLASYLQSFQMPSRQLLSQSRRTFVLGFVATANSTVMTACEMVALGDQPFNYFLSFRLSQDPIESLFSRIGQMGGFNKQH